ncbi:MAG: hypothetical protein JWN95_597 [Frankiales bacterium]|nr:hypothetical protein [Frankiales bacterium]
MSSAIALTAPETVEFDPPSGMSSKRLVLRPAPPREPPYDDELSGPSISQAGPFDRTLPFEPVDVSLPSALRLVRNTEDFAAQPTARSELPELIAFSRRFAIGIIEVVTGRRTPAQLAMNAAPAVQVGLARDAGHLTRLGSARRPATLHSVHVSEPADGVAEVAAIVRLGDRFRAIAFRLEGLDGRWRCVRLQIG